ncbi:xylem serine peptidase 1 [Wolffia australiana]
MEHLAIFFALFLVVTAGIAEAEGGARKKYIVYMGEKRHPSFDHAANHHRLLADVLGSEDDAKGSIFHSYTKSMNAFAAMLTPKEADKISDQDDVISVFPSHTRKLQTTRTWDFLGFPSDANRRPAAESDVIIGMIDSGIDPNLESFSDQGLGPPPAKWKGSCGPFENFTCNNKIIGANIFRLSRMLPRGDVTYPMDMTGHGTHTAAIAAGRLVGGASFYGLAGGTARGGVPAARIAVYKVCFTDHTCNDEDVLAAFDTAISDGVDIINLSLGTDAGLTLTDALAVGSFHALQSGILTAAAAGNQGPFHRSLMNYSPWMLTVGASTVDRELRTDLTLGDGRKFSGLTVNTFETMNQSFPLVRGYDACGTEGMELAAMKCMPESLDPEAVKGKIVHCLVIGGAGTSDMEVKRAGGAGIIVQVYEMTDAAEVYLLPAAMVNKSDGNVIVDYIKSARSPVGVITKSYVVHVSSATVPSFSGRGPNPVYRNILKPDMVAPGVDIVSAHPPRLPVVPEDDRPPSHFNILSGTSMATPHAAAAAAYVKTFHPDWSPSAIKSALMTSATVMTKESTNLTEQEYAYGAGLLNPSRAVDPGLVYDMGFNDWLTFLCAQTGNLTAIRVLTAQSNLVCTAPRRVRSSHDNLNYPSFHLAVNDPAAASAAVFRRSVTHVGGAAAVYTAHVSPPPGVNVTVVPSSIRFLRPKQRRSFKLVLRTAPQGRRPPLIVSGSLTWSDGVHSVRSPIVVSYA